ncbi:MAG: hypothetical protein ACHQ50_09040, partial [Fimbriimonadales bacterium]
VLILDLAIVTSWSFKHDGEVKDQNSAGHFGATYSIGGKPVGSIACDMQDGVLISIDLNLP